MMRADLHQWRGRFADGWTDDTLDRELPLLSELVGAQVVCAWARLDWDGPAGDSELLILDADQLRELPEGLWELLLGEGDVTDISSSPGARVAIDPNAVHWVSAHQLCVRS
jgi:hypothetical protein